MRDKSQCHVHIRNTLVKNMRMRIKQAQAMGWSKRITLLVTLLCSTSVYAVQLKTLLKIALVILDKIMDT